MPFCQSCGTAIDDQATVCASCGAQRSAAGFTPVATAAGSSGGTPITPGVPAAAAPGLSTNAAGALSYLLGLITGVVFLVVDPYKSQPFVRFHAFQSIFFNVAWIAFWIVWSILGLILTAVSKGLFLVISVPVNLLIMVGGLCLWLYLMYSAYQGKTFQIPVIGPLAAKQAGL